MSPVCDVVSRVSSHPEQTAVPNKVVRVAGPRTPYRRRKRSPTGTVSIERPGRTELRSDRQLDGVGATAWTGERHAPGRRAHRIDASPPQTLGNLIVCDTHYTIGPPPRRRILPPPPPSGVRVHVRHPDRPSGNGRSPRPKCGLMIEHGKPIGLDNVYSSRRLIRRAA